jgi:hypothetical protein
MYLAPLLLRLKDLSSKGVFPVILLFYFDSMMTVPFVLIRRISSIQCATVLGEFEKLLNDTS